MAIEGATQPLVAAFSFGIVVNAASAALFLYISGHGTAIFRDGLRLVLITFLLAAALWAQVAFIATVLDTTTTTTPCQVGIIFSTLFDQVGRFAVEQYLLWAMNTGERMSVAQMLPQTLVVGRFVAGIVFVGYSKPQTDTVCLAASSSLPAAITVIALDGVLVAVFAARAFMTRMVADIQANNSSAARSKSVLLVMVGFAIWTGTSVAMLLGMPEVDLIVRTTVPAGGLSILIVIVTACMDHLATPRDKPSRPPEAPSPRRINISRDISSSGSDDWPPSRYEDLKEQAIRGSTTFLQPRAPPRISDEKEELPNIARPIPGITGIGGVAIQGELFPPGRTETVITSGATRDVNSGNPKKKKAIFDFGKGGADRTGPAARPVIGNPILQGDNPQNPLNKIPTMDLQEAARAEKERRAMALRRESELIAKRPAPPPPPVSPDEGLKRAVSFKRKEVASIASQATLSTMYANQQSGWAASTTSAQLSPGVEELRRRSPRQSPQAQPDESQQSRPGTPATAELALEQPRATSPPVPAPVTGLTADSAAKPAPTTLQTEKKSSPATQAQASIVRPAIRPSRNLPPSPNKAVEPEAPKTMLQRRPTNGLPGNPRARGMKVGQELGEQTQQTVMFVNNIVYDDPTGVQSIIEGATDKASKSQAGVPTRTASVVNRPRPIPRKAAERSSTDLSKHRRSRSGGSLISRKSILMSTPGSPTQLPPLPPPPKSAGPGLPSRPHPNNTKSMTVDEKMSLFFPSPPSGSMKEKTLAPILPPIPTSFLDSNNSPTGSDDHRRSNRTTRTSIKTEDVLSVDELPLGAPQSERRRSPEGYRDMTDEASSSWLQDNSNKRTPRTASSSGANAAKRASSPVLPPVRSSAWTESTDTRTQDDTMTNWDSIHSPQVAIGVQVARRVAKATDIQGTKPTGDRGSEEVAFMLDPSAHADVGKPGTWYVDDSNQPAPGRGSPSQWHRRVGDECPTFSGRKEQARSRKMPPPTPLCLKAGSSKKAMVVQTAEPSPVESPKQAIEKIQAQLKKLEQPNRDSTESQARRLALLENLEMEMGAEEDRWHEMQHDIGRDSLSTIKTSPNRNSRRESLLVAGNIPEETSIRSSIAFERRQSRRARMRSSTVSKSSDVALNDADNSRVSLWQQRLADAQMEYMDNVVDRSRLSVNFLTMPIASLGSPTPPESDESDDDIRAIKNNRIEAVISQSPRGQARQKTLWRPETSETKAGTRSAGHLWTPSANPTKKADTALPGPSIRPAPRRQTAPLRIQSAQLWTKPHNTKTRATGGLWRPAWVAPQPSAEPQRTSKSDPQAQTQKAPRPLTQRPPRRNKRVTLLPDIVENPEPMPDKRGTLGIFQFPWGERSDTASVQPTRSTMVMAMPGTMTSGGQASKVAHGHNVRSRQLESAEYSSSFFDDYDDEDQERDSDDGEGDDTDDDFDETTLWEIANLLKSDSVPSKFSLLPPRHPSSVVDDYMNDIPSDDDGGSSRHSIVIGLAEDPQVAVKEPQKSREPVLWNPPAASQDAHHGKGLPHPNEKTWEAYGGNAETARAKPRMAAPATIESDNLWAPKSDNQQDMASSKSGPMWTAKQMPSKIPRSAKTTMGTEREQAHVSRSLWSPSAESKSEGSEGMFAIDSSRSEYRTTSKEPAAQTMTRKPRASISQPLDQLTSTSMWSSKTSGSKSRFQETSHGLWNPPSTLEEVETQGMFTINRSRSTYRTTEKEPAAKDMQRKPRLTEQKPLEPLTSTALWAAEMAQPAERNWIDGNSAAATTSLPLRRQFRRIVAYRADWEAALQEALAASYPSTKRRTHRKTTTEAEWTAALEEAIALASRVEFDAAVRHPVFAASPLPATTSQEFHPAAAGYSNAPIPSPLPIMDDSIRAQIEALEQERLFAESAAKEQHLGRVSLVMAPQEHYYTPVPEPEPEPKHQGRVSLIMAPQEHDYTPVPEPEPEPKQQLEPVHIPEPVQTPEPEHKPEPEQPAVAAPDPPATRGGLWSSPGQMFRKAAAAMWTQPAPAAPEPAAAVEVVATPSEDKLGSVRRKEKRREEILARIAAIEGGAEPAEVLGEQSLWSGAEAKTEDKAGGKNWLGATEEEEKPRGVILRY